MFTRRLRGRKISRSQQIYFPCRGGFWPRPHHHPVAEPTVLVHLVCSHPGCVAKASEGPPKIIPARLASGSSLGEGAASLTRTKKNNNTTGKREINDGEGQSRSYSRVMGCARASMVAKLLLRATSTHAHTHTPAVKQI